MYEETLFEKEANWIQIIAINHTQLQCVTYDLYIKNEVNYLHAFK